MVTREGAMPGMAGADCAAEEDIILISN